MMATQAGKRIYRRATPDERAKHSVIREQIQAELPELEQRGRDQLAEALKQGVEIRQITALLKAERLNQGLSLADMNERTNIDRATLSRLENQTDANPTIGTLVRYAEAMGKKVVVKLASTAE